MSKPITNPNAVPNLDDLMARFLASAGGTEIDAALESEVEPHEVIGGFRAAATQLWREGLAVFAGVTTEKVTTPPEWAGFAALETHKSSPFAAGLFPQSLREISPLLTGGELTSLKPTGKPAPIPGFSALRSWCQKNLSQGHAATLLVTSGILAGLGDFTQAKAALLAAEPLCDGPLRALWHNQHAAVLWMSGEVSQAVAAWEQAEACVPARFNLGMANLLTGNKPVVVQHLTVAATSLPDSSGWCHLARLYLALAS